MHAFQLNGFLPDKGSFSFFADFHSPQGAKTGAPVAVWSVSTHMSHRHLVMRKSYRA
jgi:hypothetical protein